MTFRSFYSSALWRYGFAVLSLVLLWAGLAALPEKRQAGDPFPMRMVIFSILMLAMHVQSSWLPEGRFKSVFLSVTVTGLFACLAYDMTHPFRLGQTLLVAAVCGVVAWWIFTKAKRPDGKETQNA